MHGTSLRRLLASSSLAALLIGGGASPDFATSCAITETGVLVASVTNTAAINCIFIQNSTVAGSVTNTSAGNIAAIGTGISINLSTVGGGVSNAGSIASGSIGINLKNIATLAGGIVNSGAIVSQNGLGINVGNAALISGGIINTGKIVANGASAIQMFAVSTFLGGITNTGTISAPGHNNGMNITTISVFTGGISNSGTITSAGNGFTVDSISTFSGGISNTGTISGGLGFEVYLSAAISIFDSGTIIGTGGIAVDLSDNSAGNTFTLGPGYSITGTVLGHTGGGDTFQLGGSGSGVFDLSSVGASARYENVTTFNVVSGVWTVSNTFGQGQTWNVNGGTLAGTGTLPGVNVNSGGTLEPGTIGTPGTFMTITGTLAFQSGATYVVNLGPTTASRVNVASTVSLAGAVQGILTPGSYSTKTTYDILDPLPPHSITGTFTGFSSPNAPGFGGILTYTSNDVLLNLTANLGAGGGLSGNQQNVASAINSFFNNGGTLPASLFPVFGLTGTSLGNALTQLDGEAATGAQGASLQLTNSFLALLTGPTGGPGNGGGPAMPFAPERADAFPPDVALAYASALKAPIYKAPMAYEPHWTSWGAAFGGGSATNGDPAGAGTSSVSAHTGAFAAGIDYHVAPDTILGVALAGGGVNWALGSGLGGGRGDTFLAGLYGSKQSGPAYVSGALTFSSNWMSTSRSIAVAGPDTLTASFNAQNFGGRLEGGYRVPAAVAFNVTPYAAVQAQTFHSPGYSETGTLGAPDPFALTFNAQSATVVRTELGSRFDQTFAQADASTVNLFARLAWAHDWQSNPNLTATFIGLPTATFVVNGAAPPSDLALLTAGAEWRWRNGWSAMAKFDGEFASRSQTYTGTARVKYSW